MLTETRTILIGLFAGMLAAAMIALGLFEVTELRGLNTLFALRGARVAVAPVVIVSIHEDSFDDLNLAWPFPRALHAQLIEKLNRARPVAIGFDIAFPEPSSFGPDDDHALAAAVAKAGNVILASQTQDNVFVGGRKISLKLPIPEIREHAAGYGPVNLPVDPDGQIRWAVVQHRFEEEVLAGFDAHLHRLAAAHGIPARPLPGMPPFLINYVGPPKSFPWIPYYRVLRDEIEPEVFRGKIVLVGATAPILQDIWSTPFADAKVMPGVEIHAHVLETLLRGNPLREAPRLVSPVLALACALVGALFVARMRALRAFLAFTAVAAALGLSTYGFFVLGNVWLRAVGPSLGLVLGYLLPATDHFIREQREKRRLSQFFSPAVLREIVRHPEDANLGSSRRLVTVLFSDIRGFTSMSERLEPEQVAEMLGEYLSEMTEVVFKHNGTVDKYIGDCVMALYNVPFEDGQHAVNAVRTAIEFQEITRAVSAKWETKLGVQVRNGVGINTGEAVCGTMGSRQRREYTAIGDTVNLASRLETATKDQHTSIIISESTYEYVQGQFRTRELGAITVKGKTRPVKIYAVMTDDARHDSRVFVDVEVTVTTVADARTWTARTRDVSTGGVALLGLPAEVTVGTAVEVTSETPVHGAPLKATGTVVWRRESVCGVAFATPAAATPSAVADEALGSVPER